MPEFLDEKRDEIGTRLKELRPLVEEYSRLEAAVAALDSVSSSTAGTATSRRGAQHATASGSRRRGGATKQRRGRPKGSGTRAKQALELVKATPGITIPELAERMGIKQNYLYRVLPGLAEDGLVTKDGRGWRAKETSDV